MPGLLSTGTIRPTVCASWPRVQKVFLRRSGGFREREVHAFFCARSYWTEELTSCFLAGTRCFMKSPAKVVALLDWSVYHAQWPNIPAEELQASAVNLGVGNTSSFALVLLHKRRVSEAQAKGGAAAFVCHDCRGAFGGQNPRMCKFAIANHMWLGRQDPLVRDANLSHQMLLALARVVTT